MNRNEAAVFVFDSSESTNVVVDPILDWARQSLESFDVAGDGYEPAFTATGQTIEGEPSDDLLAGFELTEQLGLERLQTLLRKGPGPAHLADDPAAYACEWMRPADLDAGRPPFLPPASGLGMEAGSGVISREAVGLRDALPGVWASEAPLLQRPGLARAAAGRPVHHEDGNQPKERKHSDHDREPPRLRHSSV